MFYKILLSKTGISKEVVIKHSRKNEKNIRVDSKLTIPFSRHVLCYSAILTTYWQRCPNIARDHPN